MPNVCALVCALRARTCTNVGPVPNPGQLNSAGQQDLPEDSNEKKFSQDKGVSCVKCTCRL